jgi:shikimate kinase/3-dehydroquinate synthase
VANGRHERAIALVGFMGAGKSAMALGVAERLGVEALDADAEIERRLGMPIATYFDREGEEAFRAEEERVVLELLKRGEVVSLGGGAVESARVREALAGALPVWCRVSEPQAWERSRATGRPLARDRSEFRARFEARGPLYEEVARAILPEGGRELGALAAPWLAAIRGVAGLRLVWARSATGDYPAIVGEGALSLLEDERLRTGSAGGPARSVPGRLFAIVDREASRLHGSLLPSCAAEIEVEGVEASKSLAEVERVLRELVAAGARRDDALLAFGGGVVGDLAGFCAASYQRGVPIVQAPTTLVAQVDSAYGGKTGVDLPEAKNYVGAYHLPLAVLADPRTLATLPPEELAAGFAEVVKTALIAGGTLWDRVRAPDALEPAQLAEIVLACARTKIDVVAADERDSGRRAVLNLGHTVAHAIEAATGYRRLRHGEAVGLGLLAALRLSGADELRAETASLLARHRLPTALDADVAVEDVLAAVALDKKRTEAGIGFVLIDRPGDPREGQAVEPDRVRAAVLELQEG